MTESEEIESLINFSKMECVCHFMKQYPNYSSLPDNAHYYLPNLASLLSTDYTPTAEDILHLRVPTASVNEIYFSFNSTKIRLIDVGGQRAYRKKWIHCFEGVSAVLFVASMAAYDQSIPQQGKRSHALQSFYLRLANHCCEPFQKDIFSNKLSNHPLEDYVPGYRGSSNKDASEFLKEYFLKRKSKKDANRMIYSHFTCATDTKNVEFVFRAVCDIVLHKNIESNGIQ
ncbi:hypothetical protein PENTCL1PPCAC_15544 [Pristionchus entomophagus]|uniref:ADP ribosylation factor n=1 Tax=Pristionchus entomophagus TaxID=358040 RepID=A0AAV5TGG7_9BILA|nr:hypothetical protein PENTCL1PPCAC_15544 [Pristionchus entomophagus]